jgi:hypothetical protein
MSEEKTLGEIYWDAYRGEPRRPGWSVPHSPFSEISEFHRAAVEAGAQAVADHLRAGQAVQAASGQVPHLVLSGLTLTAVQAEATRAHLKHGEHSMLGAQVSDDRRLAILTEKVGEVARELNDTEIAGRAVDRDKLVKELIQSAAMCASWVEALEGVRS